MSRIAILIIFFIFNLSAHAKDFEVNTVAVNGYDVVEYHLSNKPIKGTTDYHLIYNDNYYLFSKAKNKDLFMNNPKKYLPQYGGYCAMGVALGRKVPTSPEAFFIHEGKLYLNVNLKAQRFWLKDLKKHIKDADNNWPMIKNLSPEKF